MRDDSFGFREQRMHDNIASSIVEVKKDLGPVLDEVVAANSALKNSFDYIGDIDNSRVNVNNSSSFAENTGYNNIPNDEVSSERLNDKVRVLTRDYPSSAPNSQPKEVVNNSVDNYNYGHGISSAQFNEQSQRPSSFGSVTTLILVFSALLILLVSLVSLMIFNYVGF